MQGPSIDMELSRNSSYDEVCKALAERLREEGQAEALNLDDPQQLRFTGQQSFSATIPKTAPYKWHGWDALHHVRAHPFTDIQLQPQQSDLTVSLFTGADAVVLLGGPASVRGLLHDKSRAAALL